jgi:hypothetical protein
MNDTQGPSAHPGLQVCSLVVKPFNSATGTGPTTVAKGDGKFARPAATGLVTKVELQVVGPVLAETG